MIPRVLEPEVMDSSKEAHDYDSMDHSHVNTVFVDDFLAALPKTSAQLAILDCGTGTAQIPIELCRRETIDCKVIATDLAGEMLKLAASNIATANLQSAIQIDLIDCKAMTYEPEQFDIVMSNSIIHHIPEPIFVFREMLRVLQPGGLLFVRDLLRPESARTVDALVEQYAAGCNAHQRSLFHASLHAALTVDEVAAMLDECGQPRSTVQQTSDRHWTIAVVK